MGTGPTGATTSTRVFLLSCVAALGAVVAVGAWSRGSEATDASQARSAFEPVAEVGPGEVDDTVLVVDLKDGTTKATYDQLEQGWGVDVEFNSLAGAQTGITTTRGPIDPAGREALLERLRKDPNVEAAEPLYLYSSRRYVPNDPQFKAQWNLEMIRMPHAWEVSRGEGVVVAVIDTGIAFADSGEFRIVPDLKGARFAKGYDFVNDDDEPFDDHGHGTHVAGTIAQRTNNGEGVAGVAFDATLMPVKVLDMNGSGTSADIADAIRWSADHGAKVLNLSLGGGGRSQVLESAVAYARKKGAVVVCAAGNAGRGVVEYPAAYPGAVAVSAVGPTGELASYSSWGKDLDIAAPGGDKRARGREEDGVLQNTIDRSRPGQSVYAWYQGTSMATPHVAGVAALLFAAGAPGPDEVEGALFQGASHAKNSSWSEKYGHGILDAQGALDALGAAGRTPFWKKLLGFAWALLLWLLTRVTLPKQVRAAVRPGLGFFAALAVTVLGVFFLPWLGLDKVAVVSAFAEPVPGWGNGLLGGIKANPLFFSALIPIVLAMTPLRLGRGRTLLAGIALGFAAVLLANGASGVQVAWMPASFLSVPWLLINGLIAWFVARAAMHSLGTRNS